MDKSNKSRLRWPERLWTAVGLLLLAVAITSMVKWWIQPVASDGITRQVQAELESVDRIEAEEGVLRGFNVVIITMDTTRADHIGCYGNRSVQTPVIDDLARSGILCAQAVTPSPATLPAHSSLLTGLFPVHHGARANGTFRLKEEVTTLAERLKANGYRTGAVISAFVLDSRFGLDQGFDLYHDDLTKGMKYAPNMFRERAAELTNEPATQWLRENVQEPFFLWVHYFDPHAVYMPPEPFRSQYANDLYDGEIAYTDSQIGVLLDELERLGVRDKTLVVYTSDHGEGLGEHDEQTHSLLIYDATLHVPLIFHAPEKLPKGKVIHRQTCLVDVVPTVLSLLGEPMLDDVDGVNLCLPSNDESRPVLIETIATMTLHGWAPLLGIRSNDFKYILAPTPELYDLDSDPRELVNIYDDRPTMVHQLSQNLAFWLGEDPYLATRQVVDLEQLDVDAEVLMHLGALGYVSASSGQADDSVAMADPKDVIGHWEKVQSASHLRAKGQPQEAIAILEECLAEVAGDIYARAMLGSIYQQIGEDERALTHLNQAAEDEPNNSSVRLNIARIYSRQRKYPEAEEKIAEALEIEPENAHAQILRGQMAMERGQDEQALQLYQKAIDMDPGTAGPGAYNAMGFLHTRAGRLDAAREAFKGTIQIDALNGAAHDGLANILRAEGKIDAAMKELAIALKFDPNQAGALATLGYLISEKGDHGQALKLCQRALAISPKFAPVHNNIGLIYRRLDQLDRAEEHYLKAIEYSPRFGVAHLNLGQLYTRQGKTEDALHQFRLAVKVNPRNSSPVALGNLGAHHFNQGEYAESFAFYRRALRFDPDYPLVHKHIASIYTFKDWDRPDLTAHHLRRSLELEPDQPDAPQLRELLARAEKEASRRKESSSRQTQQPEVEFLEPTSGSKALAEVVGESTESERDVSANN